MKDLVKKIQKILKIRFIRFLLVGGINTAVGYGLFALLTSFGLHYTFALLISTVVGILFNFKTIGLIVFQSKDNRLILKFFLVYLVGFILNNIGIWGISKLIEHQLEVYFAGAIIILPVSVLTFFLHRNFVFNQNT